MHFLERKQFYFDSSFTEIFPMGPINKKTLSIGSDNVAPNSRQAIIWTNDGTRYRRIYAALSLNEFNVDADDNPIDFEVFHFLLITPNILKTTDDRCHV